MRATAEHRIYTVEQQVLSDAVTVQTMLLQFNIIAAATVNKKCQ
jgi:hypothetical protein